jgi:hypothetical protein
MLVVGLCIHGLPANAVQTSICSAAHVYPTSIRATGVAYSAQSGEQETVLSWFHFIQTGPRVIDRFSDCNDLKGTVGLAQSITIQRQPGPAPKRLHLSQWL